MTRSGADALTCMHVCADTQTVTKLFGQREYIFTVEVAAGPPSSVFRHTKVGTLCCMMLLSKIMRLAFLPPIARALHVKTVDVDNFVCGITCVQSYHVPCRKSYTQWELAEAL